MSVHSSISINAEKQVQMYALVYRSASYQLQDRDRHRTGRLTGKPVTCPEDWQTLFYIRRRRDRNDPNYRSSHPTRL